MTTKAEAPAVGAARSVAMLIYPGVTPLDVIGPLQVFGLANHLRKQRLYDIVTVAPTAEPVPTPLGFAFMPGCAMAALALPVDTLLVSGGSDVDCGTHPDILDWLRQAAPQARRFGSICTGARRHPAVVVDIDAIFIRNGDLYTSAGISAGIDLALALVEEDHGRAFAQNVARALVLFLKRSGGQTQFSQQLQVQFSTVPAIRQTQLWCQDNLDGDLRVGTLSRIAAMSERDFERKFRQDTGRTPGDYVASARAEAACRLLGETALSMKAIAQKCGFASAAAMRRAFLQRIGVPPRQYRDNFQV